MLFLQVLPARGASPRMIREAKNVADGARLIGILENSLPGLIWAADPPASRWSFYISELQQWLLLAPYEIGGSVHS